MKTLTSEANIVSRLKSILGFTEASLIDSICRKNKLNFDETVTHKPIHFELTFWLSFKAIVQYI